VSKGCIDAYGLGCNLFGGYWDRFGVCALVVPNRRFLIGLCVLCMQDLSELWSPSPTFGRLYSFVRVYS